jgi:hypothetical protein
MARIRTIKPEFWKHEDLSALPEATHMLAAALLNHADDEGYFNANPGLVRAECCPLREPSVSPHDSLNLLRGIGFIKLGSGADGKRYGLIIKFEDHQRINRPTPSKIKAVGIVWEASPQTHTQLTESSPPERKGKEQGREQGREEELSGSPDGEPRPPITLVENARAERLAQVTGEAVTAYNAILGKPIGRLSAVHLVNDVRKDQVKRCLKTARLICEKQYQSATVAPQFWQDYFAACNADPFKNGTGPYSGEHKNWRPDFEYLTRPETMTTVFDKALSEAAA